MSMKESHAPLEPMEGGRRPKSIRDRLALPFNAVFRGRRMPGGSGETVPEAARLRTGLMTIRNLAAFVQHHPDMPKGHRDKIIESLIRESDDLKLAVERIAGGMPFDCV